MKKKHVLLAILTVLLTLSFAVIGCSDDSGGGGFEGTWVAKYGDQPGFAEYADFLEAAGLKKDSAFAELVLSADGKATFTEIEKDGKKGDTATGTYTETEKGVKATITIDGEPKEAKLSGNKLTLIASDDDDDDIVFTRK